MGGCEAVDRAVEVEAVVRLQAMPRYVDGVGGPRG